jgi:hypothetical protein
MNYFYPGKLGEYVAPQICALTGGDANADEARMITVF